MKIRGDFVTNSSSSSFVVMVVNTHDGKSYTLDIGDDIGWNEENMPQFDESGITYRYILADDPESESEIKITSVLELAAILYFNSSYYAVDYAIILPVFAFFIGKTTAKELIESLEGYEEFEELCGIDLDSFDSEEELNEAVGEALQEALYEFEAYADLSDESCIESFRELVDSIEALSDIKSIDVHSGESNWDEFTNIYSDRLEPFVTEHGFSAIDSNAPEYEEELKYWCDILEKEVFFDTETYESFGELVGNALSSGTAWDMIPRAVQTSEIKTFFLSPKQSDDETVC